MIFVHNHPSGTLTPSDHDINLTKTMIDAAKTVNLRIVDHIIVSNRDTYSFVENGLM